MTYSIILKSQLEGALRLDAEYYQPEYLELEKRLIDTNSIEIWGKIEGKFITGPFGSEFNVENYEQNGRFRYIRGKDVKEFFLQNNDNVYIPEKDFNRLKKYSVQTGDILLSVVGTLGNVSIVEDSNTPSIFSCKSTLFRSSSVNPLFLIAFLNSYYGKNLLIRNGRGHVQVGLNIEDLKNLPIFIPHKNIQKEIISVIKAADSHIKNSELLYSEAESLLLEGLGLRDFKIENDLSFVVNLSDVKSNHRADAEYFQPKYNTILSKLSSNKIDILTKNFEFIRSKNFEYEKEGEVGVIQTKQIGNRFINFGAENKAEKKIVEGECLPVLKGRDVIFASMGVGSLGKTNIFYEFETNRTVYTIDSTLRIFRTKNQRLLPEVLVVYLNSFVGQELIYKYVVGTSGIISIYENYLKNFPVPILEKVTQQKIADLVRKSHEARKRSKELLETAKRKVETLIETQSKGDS